MNFKKHNHLLNFILFGSIILKFLSPETQFFSFKIIIFRQFPEPSLLPAGEGSTTPAPPVGCTQATSLLKLFISRAKQ